VVRLDWNSCEIWAGDQFQTIDQANAAATAGLRPEQAKIHTLYAGGSFGRRANTVSDYIVEAVSVAKALGANGKPVKLIWTREDDIRGGRYRPMYFHAIEAGLDRDGALALPFSTAGMYRGFVREGGAIHTAIYDEPYRSE